MAKAKPKPAQRTPKASTPDVLGSNVGQSNVAPKWEKQYRALAKARDAILARRKDLVTQAAEDASPPQRNPADLGTDEYDRDWALSMASNEQEMLYEIEQALNRIKNGTYGICEATDKPIEPKRLAAIPWTRFSKAAERELEADGQIHRARLGDREEVPKEKPSSSQDEE